MSYFLRNLEDSAMCCPYLWRKPRFLQLPCPIREREVREDDNLRSLNQLTLVALNALDARLMTEKQKMAVEKNTRVITTQIPAIDQDETIVGLFEDLLGKIEEAQAKVQYANQSLESTSRLNLLIVVVFLFIAPLMVGVIIFSLNHAILRPVNHLLAIAHQMVEGDLSANIILQQHSEIGTLARALRTMIAQFRNVVSDVKQASSSMEQMVANIRQNADNAVQTEAIVVKAATDALAECHD
jgi:methyl-accepting chemotaxis protein